MRTNLFFVAALVLLSLTTFAFFSNLSSYRRAVQQLTEHDDAIMELDYLVIRFYCLRTATWEVTRMDQDKYADDYQALLALLQNHLATTPPQLAASLFEGYQESVKSVREILATLVTVYQDAGTQALAGERHGAEVLLLATVPREHVFLDSTKGLTKRILHERVIRHQRTLTKVQQLTWIILSGNLIIFLLFFTLFFLGRYQVRQCEQRVTHLQGDRSWVRAFAESWVPVLLLLLTAGGGVRAAEVLHIPRAHRVANEDPGCCTWACLETTGNYLSLPSLQGLTRARAQRALEIPQGESRPRDDSAGTLERIRTELSHRQVRFRFQLEGDYSLDLLRTGLAQGVPILLSVRDYPEPGSYHAVLLLGLSDEQVTVLDPNDVEHNRAFARSWLAPHWTGRAVLLLGSSQESVAPCPRLGPPLAGVSCPSRASSLTPSGTYAAPLLALSPRSESLLAAMRRGKADCRRVLLEEFALTPREAEATLERLWRRPLLTVK
jgi:hypothetical protein